MFSLAVFYCASRRSERSEHLLLKTVCEMLIHCIMFKCFPSQMFPLCSVECKNNGIKSTTSETMLLLNR